MVSREKIIEPVLRKITEDYRNQKKIYNRVLGLTKEQNKIKSRDGLALYKELSLAKMICFEEIEQSKIKQGKNIKDIVEFLKIEDFTISALKAELKTEVLNELSEALKETAEIIKEIETAENKNEEFLKTLI